MMFNDWQVTHFHLVRVFVTPTMAGGTSELLYAHVTAECATLLDVLPHERWTAQDLLRILLETRPEAMERVEQKRIPGETLTDEELLTLRMKKHTNVAISVASRAFVPSGIMSSGHALRFR